MVIIWLMMVNNNLVGGWAYPAEKYEFVNWDDEIPNIWKNKIHVPNHKSDIEYWILASRILYQLKNVDLIYQWQKHLQILSGIAGIDLFTMIDSF